jgi:hypothetical protein
VTAAALFDVALVALLAALVRPAWRVVLEAHRETRGTVKR